MLPAGTYVFQLADSAASRHIVQVFGPDGRMLARVWTIPTGRRIAADDTQITFEEPAGRRPISDQGVVLPW